MTLQSSPPKEQRMRGVFSTQEIRKVGTGTTTRKSVQKVFWFVEQEEDNIITVQPLNTHYVPSGAKRPLSMEELLEKFSPEPEFYVQSVYPKMQELEESIANAEGHREKNETFTAEYEYGHALKLDEENVRANFGIGLTYLARGEVDKADNIFGRLVHLDAAFEPEHKHLFNDFGINLRKNKMYDQSVEYYTRALELTKGDENLHINMARALMEQQNYNECTTHLLKALELSPKNSTAIKFLEWLDKKNLVPKAQDADVRSILAAFNAPEEEIHLA